MYCTCIYVNIHIYIYIYMQSICYIVLLAPWQLPNLLPRVQSHSRPAGGFGFQRPGLWSTWATKGASSWMIQKCMVYRFIADRKCIFISMKQWVHIFQHSQDNSIKTIGNVHYLLNRHVHNMVRLYQFSLSNLTDINFWKNLDLHRFTIDSCQASKWDHPWMIVSSCITYCAVSVFTASRLPPTKPIAGATVPQHTRRSSESQVINLTIGWEFSDSTWRQIFIVEFVQKMWIRSHSLPRFEPKKAKLKTIYLKLAVVIQIFHNLSN